jgi:hypothetical protein
VVEIDWTVRADYVRTPHGVEPEWANEAVQDDHAVWLRPDPGSFSGHSLRVIGYSRTAGEILTVILVSPDADPSERLPTKPKTSRRIGASVEELHDHKHDAVRRCTRRVSP